MSMLKRLDRHQMTTLIARGDRLWQNRAGKVTEFLSEREYFGGMIIGKCVSAHTTGSEGKRGMKMGPNGYETDEEQVKKKSTRGRDDEEEAEEEAEEENEDEEDDDEGDIESDGSNLGEDDEDELDDLDDEDLSSDEDADGMGNGNDEDAPFDLDSLLAAHFTPRFRSVLPNSDYTKLGEKDVPADPEEMFWHDFAAREKDVAGIFSKSTNADGIFRCCPCAQPAADEEYIRCAAKEYIGKAGHCILVGETNLACQLFKEIYFASEQYNTELCLLRQLAGFEDATDGGTEDKAVPARAHWDRLPETSLQRPVLHQH